LNVLVTVIIPAHNEAETVAKVVEVARNDADEVLVVDSCSSDNTRILAAEAGAKVIHVDTIGKHRALQIGIAAARGEELVFLDADLREPNPDIVKALLGGLRRADDIVLSKGYYGSSSSQSNEGGRLTELCARPLMTLLYPHLSSIRQPLGGEYALRRDIALHVPLAPGYAVDLGILLHCAAIGTVAQVDLGTKRHKHRPLLDLGKAAVEIAAVLLNSAGWHFSKTVLSQFPGGGVMDTPIDLESLEPLVSLNDKTLPQPLGELP